MFPYVRPFNIHPPSVSVDNTPNAVNWGDIVFFVADDFSSVTSKQITGISSSITLQVDELVSMPNIELYYRIDSSEQTGPLYGQPTSPWTKAAENVPYSTFSVSNNQWVSFACYATSANKTPQTITVTNTSDNNTVLDTFTIDSDP